MLGCRRRLSCQGYVCTALDEGRSWTESGRRQGLTLVHVSAQRKHVLWGTLGA